MKQELIFKSRHEGFIASKIGVIVFNSGTRVLHIAQRHEHNWTVQFVRYTSIINGGKLGSLCCLLYNKASAFYFRDTSKENLERCETCHEDIPTLTLPTNPFIPTDKSCLLYSYRRNTVRRYSRALDH
jgi:hypothetical protein